MTHERTKKNNKQKASEMNLAAILLCIVFVFLLCHFPRDLIQLENVWLEFQLEIPLEIPYSLCDMSRKLSKLRSFTQKGESQAKTQVVFQSETPAKIFPNELCPRIMLNVHEFFMTEDIIACGDGE